MSGGRPGGRSVYAVLTALQVVMRGGETPGREAASEMWEAEATEREEPENSHCGTFCSCTARLGPGVPKLLGECAWWKDSVSFTPGRAGLW